MLLGIIGAGRWGTALAKTFADNFEMVNIIARDREVIQHINEQNCNTKYFPNLILPNNIQASSNIQVLQNADVILITTPTQYIRKTLQPLQGINKPIYLVCSKGIDAQNKKLISNILLDELQINNIGVLSGPSFATETANKLPTALVLAIKDYNPKLMQTLTASNLRIYYSNDIIGSQVGGAVKNVIAIAGGLIKGSQLGHNALAAIVSRGLHDILVINKHFGGHDSSIFGLTGLGDLLLSTTSENSRNYSLGYNIGVRGKFDVSMINELKGVAEGYYTVKVLYEIMQENNLNMPICKEVYEICYNNKSLKNSLKDLMERPLKYEFTANNEYS